MSYKRGISRTRLPAETFEVVEPALLRAGITRVADVTGLDRIGIPVFMATRPNSRSVAVSQGKGSTLEAARTSAVMEALEAYVAEFQDVEHDRAPLRSPPAEARVIDWQRLPRQGAGDPALDTEVGWTLGENLLTGEPIWAPLELVHQNYTIPQPPGHGWLFASSNGLASGNTPGEALVHGLCELIERDSRTRWASRPNARVGTRVDPISISTGVSKELLERFDQADIDCGIWDISGPVGLPAFICSIKERGHSGRISAKVDSGSGCHPNREIALARAITEAAQMRLTYLVGARDDQAHAYYAPSVATGHGPDLQMIAGGKQFTEIPTMIADSPQGDLDYVLSRLTQFGADQIFAYHFDADELLGLKRGSISVARVIVPGLAGPMEAYNHHLLGATRIS
ncbi:MAG: YcaO-like family protein [Hyphomicrobiaceae bacterium]